MNIEDIQKQLQLYNIDGWLLYDFHGKNPLALEVMKVPKEMLMTRRCFYWVPYEGAPKTPRGTILIIALENPK